MSLKTREELEQLLEDIQSRLSVVETAQTKPKDEPKGEEPKDEPSEQLKEPSEQLKEPEVESEDEIEKLLNA